MAKDEWQFKNCLFQISTDRKKCTGCDDRHYTCKKCGGPVFRVGCYGDGIDCYHCGAHYEDNYKGITNE